MESSCTYGDSKTDTSSFPFPLLNISEGEGEEPQSLRLCFRLCTDSPWKKRLYPSENLRCIGTRNGLDIFLQKSFSPYLTESGGSGSGKTRYYVKTNLMQMHSSYVVTDSKVTVVLECAKMLKNHGYRIKILNTINFNKSMHYNPFNYIHSEKDILKLVNTLIANTKGEGEKPNSFALRQYKKYKLAAGKTARSILISCGARLAPFDIAELRKIMSYDELELDTLGDKKSALFIVTSDTDSTFDFITALCISQMMNVLCTKADDYYSGSSECRGMVSV